MRGRKRQPPAWSKHPWTLFVADQRIIWLRRKMAHVQSPKRVARYERQLLHAQTQHAAMLLSK